jgi:long-chain acyl-CoA synthetase
MNYCELLFNTTDEDLNKEAFIDAERGIRLSYRELQEEVKKTARFLRNKGYKPGDVILTHLYNSNEAAVILLGVQYLGGVIALVDPLFKPFELKYYIEDSRACCIITHHEKEDLQTSLGGNVEILNINEVRGLPAVDDFPFHDYGEDELAMLLYTSGSTSTPKGVMLSPGCFFTFLKKSQAGMYRYVPEDRLLCFVPFSHAYGSVSLLLPSLLAKSAIVFLRAFQPTKIANTIEKEKITHIFGVPTHYQQLLRYKNIYPLLKKLKAAFSAAAPLSYDTAKTWHEVTGIYLDEGYGMTETTTLITTRLNMLPEPPGNVGFPPEDILTLETVDGAGKVCEEGILGEIRLKGGGTMLGYYDRPEATAAMIRDGWLYTGDFGYRRRDGSFVICGRKTEFINVAGLKISPIEIEAVLNSHPAVLDSAVIGIDDPLYGEVVKAFVVLKGNKSITERELIRYLSDKIANFKIPKSISIIEKMPRNNIGKIDKKQLKAME